MVRIGMTDMKELRRIVEFLFFVRFSEFSIFPTIQCQDRRSDRS